MRYPVFRLVVVWCFVQLSPWAFGGPSNEVAPTTITGKLAEGTEWETDYHLVNSGVEGPMVVILGGMHGNEPAGARAADQIRHWPVVKGQLLVVPRVNVQALKANSRYTPRQPDDAKNLNRNFPQLGEGKQRKAMPRGVLATSLWKLIFEGRPDWVIDLHEGYEFRRSHKPPEGKKKSVGSSVIYRGGKEMDLLVERVIAAADETVVDPDKRFVALRGGPVSTGVAAASINVLWAEGLILETTYTGQPVSLRTRQHRAMVNVLLNHIGTIDRDCRDILAPVKKTKALQVGVFDGVGTGQSKYNVFSILDAASDMALHHVGPAEMRPEVLEQFDVVVFPGGSGSRQAKAIGESGRTAVRGFVKEGGGLLGICAGAYLCSSHYTWSLDLIDSSVFTGSMEIPGEGKKQLWYRGKESGIDLELTPRGRELYGAVGIPPAFQVRYANGPIISPKGNQALEDYEVLAWFRSETGLWEAQKGTMIDTPAIVSGCFGKGRIISMSPHPEKTPSLHPIITQTIRWTANSLAR